ncbi:unnamed protein product [Allacma fusca]|uniref:Uncharacterized protein n=1 Tax=Allacma fusca TaxID=39272 RepID=A0A8J2JCX8_9HEXA|nr:unnamed protein product [Allacma fusca]
MCLKIDQQTTTAERPRSQVVSAESQDIKYPSFYMTNNCCGISNSLHIFFELYVTFRASLDTFHCNMN